MHIQAAGTIYKVANKFSMFGDNMNGLSDGLTREEADDGGGAACHEVLLIALSGLFYGHVV